MECVLCGSKTKGVQYQACDNCQSEHEVRTMDKHAKEIIKIIHNSLDLCGSWLDEVRDYCRENHIHYEGKAVQEACFIGVTTYPKR